VALSCYRSIMSSLTRGPRKGQRRYRATTREGMRVTTIALPDEMFRELSHAAIDEDVSMTELVRQLAADYLRRRAAKRGKPR